VIKVKEKLLQVGGGLEAGLDEASSGRAANASGGGAFGG
jgi:hypothetical protein